MIITIDTLAQDDYYQNMSMPESELLFPVTHQDVETETEILFPLLDAPPSGLTRRDHLRALIHEGRIAMRVSFQEGFTSVLSGPVENRTDLLSLALQNLPDGAALPKPSEILKQIKANKPCIEQALD